MHLKTTLVLSLLAVGLAAAADDAAEPAPEQAAWLGVYSSPKEIGGFTGTVLSIEKGVPDGLSYRMTFYTDVILADAIEQSELRGDVLTNGDQMYVGTASGYILDGKPTLFGTVKRYTRATINGRVVLLRDDALQAYRKDGTLYDYGILIRVSEKAARLGKLAAAPHESITVLQRNPKKEWKDPFIHGPNPQ